MLSEQRDRLEAQQLAKSLAPFEDVVPHIDKLTELLVDYRRIKEAKERRQIEAHAEREKIAKSRGKLKASSSSKSSSSMVVRSLGKEKKKQEKKKRVRGSVECGGNGKRQRTSSSVDNGHGNRWRMSPLQKSGGKDDFECEQLLDVADTDRVLADCKRLQSELERQQAEFMRRQRELVREREQEESELVREKQRLALLEEQQRRARLERERLALLEVQRRQAQERREAEARQQREEEARQQREQEKEQEREKEVASSISSSIALEPKRNRRKQRPPTRRADDSHTLVLGDRWNEDNVIQLGDYVKQRIDAEPNVNVQELVDHLDVDSWLQDALYDAAHQGAL
jgi:hypothetical protein